MRTRRSVQALAAVNSCPSAWQLTGNCLRTTNSSLGLQCVPGAGWSQMPCLCSGLSPRCPQGGHWNLCRCRDKEQPLEKGRGNSSDGQVSSQEGGRLSHSSALTSPAWLEGPSSWSMERVSLWQSQVFISIRSVVSCPYLCCTLSSCYSYCSSDATS